MKNILPKKLTKDSAVNLVHLSSRVESGDVEMYKKTLVRLEAMFPRTKEFVVRREKNVPWYLAGSEHERLLRLREALVGMDWLSPVYGGTGCGDVVRRLNEQDLAHFVERRPIVNGFSDATFLLNHLYFRTGLRTFHYTNTVGLFSNDASDSFFAVLRGEKETLRFKDARSYWLSEVPLKPIVGTAIGGNLTTFRDLLDVTALTPETWQSYILFIEDLDLDAEIFHRILISLDARGVFKQIRGLVIGQINEPHRSLVTRVTEAVKGIPRGESWKYVEHVLRETLEARKKAGDPLPILKIENFGHGVSENSMILPIGSDAVLNEDCSVEFKGPFVGE